MTPEYIYTLVQTSVRNGGLECRQIFLKLCDVIYGRLEFHEEPKLKMQNKNKKQIGKLIFIMAQISIKSK